MARAVREGPDGEFDRLLDELASGPGLPHLPNDFSRADTDADHA